MNATILAAEVRDRLVASYAGRSDVSEEEVRHTFETVSKRYADAHVRAFVPILVGRDMRRSLGR